MYIVGKTATWKRIPDKEKYVYEWESYIPCSYEENVIVYIFIILDHF